LYLNASTKCLKLITLSPTRTGITITSVLSATPTPLNGSDSPLYNDSGTSLWYNTARIGRTVESKLFKKNHEDQLDLVQNLKWFNYDAMRGIDEMIRDILSGSADIDAPRRDA